MSGWGCVEGGVKERYQKNEAIKSTTNQHYKRYLLLLPGNEKDEEKCVPTILDLLHKRNIDE